MKKIEKKTSIKKHILEILRSGEDAVSGEVIANKLGVSRVAIWKNIKKLIEHGYEINVLPNGYFLKKTDDFLYPWEFLEFEDKIIYLDSVTSTLDYAMKIEIEKGFDKIQDGLVVVSEKQINGRCFSKKNWISDIGGLFFTYISKKNYYHINRYIENLYSLASIYRLMNRYFNEDNIDIVMPNSIYVNNKKIAGVLVEQFISGDNVRISNVGVGINVNNAVNKLSATTLHKELGKNISRREVLYQYLQELDGLYYEKDIVQYFRRIWKNRLVKKETKIINCKDIDDYGGVIF